VRPFGALLLDRVRDHGRLRPIKDPTSNVAVLYSFNLGNVRLNLSLRFTPKVIVAVWLRRFLAVFRAEGGSKSLKVPQGPGQVSGSDPSAALFGKFAIVPLRRGQERIRDGAVSLGANPVSTTTTVWTFDALRGTLVPYSRLGGQ